MAFVGVVHRIVVGTSGNGRPAALLAFDDVLIFAKLRTGTTLGIGGGPSKQDQASIQEMSSSGDVTPDAVKQRWPDSLMVATTDIRAASLTRSLQGAAFGTRRLSVDVDDGSYAFLVPRAAQEPLQRVLSAVVDERFQPD
jgi:hypothetical protein